MVPSYLPVNRTSPDSESDSGSAGSSRKEVHHSQNFATHPIYLPIALTGPHWHGWDSLKNLVVFGDSYSASVQEGGVEDFRWPGHVASLLDPFPLEVHDFALPGATAEYHLTSELALFFKRFSKKTQGDSETVILDPDSTTYVLFFGINDCGKAEADDLEPITEVIFDTVHRLYIRASARNFVFIDVPPIDRSPGGSTFAAELKNRVETWNDLLRKKVADLATVGTQAPRSVFMFSSNAVITDVLNDPVKYGFAEKDITQEGGRIWEDALHVTSDVQKVIAEQLVNVMLS